MRLTVPEELTAEQCRALASKMLKETAHRGMFVRLNSALVARQLNERADVLERGR